MTRNSSRTDGTLSFGKLAEGSVESRSTLRVPAPPGAVCEACGAPLPSEPRRGPRRKLCHACAGPAAYNVRWRAAHPEYVAQANAARRVSYPPRVCPCCAHLFTPGRRDAIYCCPMGGRVFRDYGPYVPEGAAWHWRKYHPGGDGPSPSPDPHYPEAGASTPITPPKEPR